MLLIIEGDSNDQLFEQHAGPLDDIQLPVGYRIKTPWINGDAHERNRCFSLLFPFDRARRLARDIVTNAIDAFYFVDDSGGDSRQDFVGNPHPVGGHAILAFDDPQRNRVFISSLVAHHPDRSHRQKNRE